MPGQLSCQSSFLKEAATAPSNCPSSTSRCFLLESPPKKKVQASKSSLSEPKNPKRPSHLTTRRKSRMPKRLPRSQRSRLLDRNLTNSSCNPVARVPGGKISASSYSCSEPWLIKITPGGSSPVKRSLSQTLSICTCRKTGVG